MDDELIHILRCIWESEPGDAIAAGFGGSEGDVEEGDVCRGENGEVVGHFFFRFLGVALMGLVGMLVGSEESR